MSRTERIRILTVVGARPQFIKASAMSRVFAEDDRFEELIVHTGQHFDANMSEIFFQELKIPKPMFNLEINGGTHGVMTASMLIEIEALIIQQKPDYVLLYGDTNSTLAGALAASKLSIPVIHIEAGLRSFNKAMPEEINRILTDHVSSLMFCPTSDAVKNLSNENISIGVHMVGDIMYDAAIKAKEVASRISNVLSVLKLEGTDYSVCTVHRADNTSDPASLEKVCSFLEEQAKTVPMVFPLHPRTGKMLKDMGRELKGVKVVDPLGYIDFTELAANATHIYTDSGGLQKEAYFHRVPCTTLRPETEWTETILSGWNRLWEGPERNLVKHDISDYGDGNAAGMIADLIHEYALIRIGGL